VEDEATGGTGTMKWARFNHYFFKYWKLQAVAVLLGMLVVPLAVANPYITKLIVDKAYAGKNLRLFLVLAILAGGIFLVQALVNALTGYLSRRVSESVAYDMRRNLFGHLQRFDLGFFNEGSTGEHLFVLTSDVSKVSSFVCSVIPQLVTLVPKLVLILGVVFYLNWKLALFALALVPVSYVNPYFFGKLLRDLTRQARTMAKRVFIRVNEVFNHMHLVKALGKEQHEIAEFDKRLAVSLAWELKNIRLSGLSELSNSVVNRTLGGVIALYGGYQVIRGTMTLGSLTAIMIYLGQLMGLLRSLGTLYQQTAVTEASRQRLGEVFDTRPRITDTGRSRPYHIQQGKIELKNVTFGYRKDTPVLRDVSFVIPPSSAVALVGLSGCGKTTLLSLILRLYEQETGAVLIDDIDTREITIDSLKAQIGVALQEPFLWNDSVAHNIAYGACTTPGRDDVIRVARLAEAHDFIMRFPRGYESDMGEMARKLSDGQRQRIAVARALIRQPRILILDEALSSIDSLTEDRIIENIKRNFAGTTIITVSHRLSTVRAMERILFVQSPSSVETGTHEELIQRYPAYTELFASQMERESMLPG
jgi:ATP-binding cassette subfamily B protein